jgi:hypothetical protein
MFFFDSILAADAQLLGGVVLIVDTMDCTPTFNDVVMGVSMPVDTMVCTPAFNDVILQNTTLTVETMAINVVFNDVILKASGGQPFLGAGIGVPISQSVAHAVNKSGG